MAVILQQPVDGAAQLLHLLLPGELIAALCRPTPGRGEERPLGLGGRGGQPRRETQDRGVLGRTGGTERGGLGTRRGGGGRAKGGGPTVATGDRREGLCLEWVVLLLLEYPHPHGEVVELGCPLLYGGIDGILGSVPLLGLGELTGLLEKLNQVCGLVGVV